MFAVVLAGGHGTRLWPLSRRARPKQFIDVDGGGSLLRQTIMRLRPILPPSRVLVVTVQDYVSLVKSHVPELPVENILVEPMKKGTAAAVGMAMSYVMQLAPAATMLVMPADHIIIDPNAYVEALRVACKFAAMSEHLVVIGIKPTFPATGYGYMLLGASLEEASLPVFDVERFVEKPSMPEAESLLLNQRSLWNTGMLACSLPSLQRAFERHLPCMVQAVSEFQAARVSGSMPGEEVYASIPAISIEHAIMERADNVRAVRGSFRRIDLGDLRSFRDMRPEDRSGNVAVGHFVGRDSARNVVYSPERLTVLVGIHDAVVIVTEDVVLVCSDEMTQEIRSLVGTLEAGGFEDYV